jgi:hypothetical protein
MREVANLCVALLLMCYGSIGGYWSEGEDWIGGVGLDCHLFRDFGYVMSERLSLRMVSMNCSLSCCPISLSFSVNANFN